MNKKIIALSGVVLLGLGSCSLMRPIPMLSAQATSVEIVDNEAPRYYAFNNNFTVSKAEYLNIAGGSVKFYRYTLSYNLSPMMSDTTLSFLRRDILFFSLPLSFLNYDYSSNITLTSNSITKSMVNDTSILIPDSALMYDYNDNMFVKDNTFNAIFVIPTLDTTAKSGYSSAFNNMIVHNKASLLFTIASGQYTDGYIDGYEEAIEYYEEYISTISENAYNSGLSEGYGQGYSAGIDSIGGLDWLRAVFDTTASIFSIEIIPGFTLGFVALFPVLLLLVKFILDLGKGD